MQLQGSDRLAVRERSHDTGSAANLSHDPLERIVCADLLPVDVREGIIPTLGDANSSVVTAEIHPRKQHLKSRHDFVPTLRGVLAQRVRWSARVGIISQHLGTLAQINEASMCKNLGFGDLHLQAGTRRWV